jgi:NAD(P)-dependent dehydrogenase (short-subunit alcohol dehydrogenase family)
VPGGSPRERSRVHNCSGGEDHGERGARRCGDRGGRRGRTRGTGGAAQAGRGGGDRRRLAEAVDAARYAHGGATVTGETVDLLDLNSTREWAARVEKDFGRVDGLVHLVGGWRGSETFTKTNLDDWDLLELLLVRTVQHTSLAFHEALQRSDRGRYVLISAAGASKPTAGNAAYSAAKAAAEAWTLAMADYFRKAGGEQGPTSAAAILVVKALVHDAMRAERPNAKFAGFTDVKDLAEAITGVWEKPAAEVNGNRLWLTEKP